MTQSAATKSPDNDGIASFYGWNWRRPGLNEEEVKARLRAAFPGWRFLLSDRNRWWALRGPLPSECLNEVDAIDADTPEALRARLRSLGDQPHLETARRAAQDAR